MGKPLLHTDIVKLTYGWSHGMVSSGPNQI